MVNNQFSDFIDDVVSSLVLGKEYQANVQIEKGRGRRYGNEIDDCTRSYSILLESKPINTYEVTGITIDPNVIDDDNS